MTERMKQAIEGIAGALDFAPEDFAGERFRDLLEEAERSGLIVFWNAFSVDELSEVIPGKVSS